MKNKIPPLSTTVLSAEVQRLPTQTHPQFGCECASEREMVRLLFIAQMCIPTLDEVLLLWPRGMTALVAYVQEQS